MSDFPVNEGREDIENTDIKQDENFADDGFSTIFADPTEHKDKRAKGSNKKRLLSVVAAFLAVAILVGGTVAVVKLIPEKDDDDSSSSEDSSISVIELDTDKINSVTVKNKTATFKLVATRTEKKAEGDEKATVETVWSVEGTDAKFTSSVAIQDVVNTAASISAVSEITGRSEKECGLDKPSFVVSLKTEDADTTITFGGLSADGMGYYAKLSDKESIYLVDYSLVQNFEFELLDFADTTAIAGIASTDVNVKYQNEGTITSFDSITVSGKNFPETMVVKSNSDSSELSQYFGYVITSPNERVADKIDTVFNLFTNGLSVSGAYAFDVSPSSLKKVGLDNPYLTAKIVLGDYTRTYKISKVDDEYCAVVTDNSYMIHKVSASSIAFLDYNIENFYSNMAYLKSITDLSNLTLNAGNESYSFGIKYNEEAEDEKFEITHNGNKITAEFFQNFYQDFVGVTYTDFKEDGNTSDIELSVTVTFLDGHKETVAFAKDSATKYSCIINGKCLGRVSSTDINRLLKGVRNVSQNKDVP